MAQPFTTALTAQAGETTLKKIKGIRKKKKVPIIVGGTGLYFKALTDGLVKIPNIPIRLRNKIRIMQNQLGQKKFYKKLLFIYNREIKKQKIIFKYI